MKTGERVILFTLDANLEETFRGGQDQRHL
jgi:hypothetical protein